MFSDADLAVIRDPDGGVVQGSSENGPPSRAEAEARTREGARDLGRIYLGVVAVTAVAAVLGLPAMELGMTGTFHRGLVALLTLSRYEFT